MTLYEKLMNMRVALQKMNLKKSGRNAYAGYDYYELADFLPYIMELELQNKVCSLVTFDSDNAILTLVDVEKPEERISFTSPMAEASLKGAHAIQNLGAAETYQRRYLYMVAYEIVEADVLDKSQGKEQTQRPEVKKSALSKDNADALNAKLKAYCEFEGIQPKEALAKLSQQLGFSVATIGDKDVQKVLGKIEELMDIPF